MNKTDTFAKLEAEPDNRHDKNAIAVYMMSSSRYGKVDYLASELTCFVHHSSCAFNILNLVNVTVFLLLFNTASFPSTLLVNFCFNIF